MKFFKADSSFFPYGIVKLGKLPVFSIASYVVLKIKSMKFLAEFLSFESSLNLW